MSGLALTEAAETKSMTMNRWRFPILFLGLTLLVSGCDSLRPPSQERAAWEYEQRQQAKSLEPDDGTWDLLYWMAYYLGTAFAH